MQNQISGNNTTPMQIMSVSPVIFKVPGRIADLEIRVSAPVSGKDLPIILLSHGHGASNFLSSFRGYAPLADFFAAHGFVVIQPTHQDSKTLALDPNGPEGALFWKSRAQDMHFILDHLDEIETAVPGLGGRMDKHRVAAIGHSMGGHTVAMLAGMRVTDFIKGEEVNLEEPRIKAFVMFGTPGNGGDLAEWASQHYPALKGTNFSEMKREVLVVAGDKDAHPNFSSRSDWRTDAYNSSPGPKCLLTVFGSGHMLGGISGYDVAETDDENPQTISFVRNITLSYLMTALNPGDTSWEDAQEALKNDPSPLGRIECK